MAVASSAPSPSGVGTVRRFSRLLLLTFFGIGLLARGVLLWLAPAYGFAGDHVDYVCWGRQTVNAGVLDLYRHPPEPCLSELTLDGVRARHTSGTGEKLNYPPLAAYTFWLQGRLLRQLDPTMLANTLTSRLAFATGTTVAELLIALGTLVLVRGFAGPLAGLVAFGATWLAPPLLLDGAFWGQTESWVLAPAVWMLVAMVRGRWLVAGLCFGLALALKPSGLLFGPLWLYAFLFRPPRLRVVGGGVVALVVLNLIALPFWLDSGRTWLDVTFLNNFVYRLHWTTAMTFNIWYVDLLVSGVLDARAPLFGISRDTWGALLLVAGIGLAYGLAYRWERHHSERAALGMIPLAALVTLAAVTLPTRVHCTYGAFTVPFLIATAFLVPRATLGAAVCLVTISLQILSWQWGQLLAMHVLPDETFFKPEVRTRRQAMREHDRPREWALTLVNLAGVAAVTIAVAGAARSRDEREAMPS